MKLLLTLLLWVNFAGTPDLASIRKMYTDVAKSENNAKDFVEKLSGVSNNDDKILVAYKAASILLDSKFENILGNKISRFKEGAKLLESVIASDPNNIEIRMIRLSIQENVPGITGYKKNIKEDKKYIAAHYAEQNASLKEYLKDFVLQSKSFSAKEKQFVK
ncbi:MULTISPECIES: hypothetical protein [unclassified Flavobacterium]|jgi:hypothetical protein|uniref:hypothetical protein n=1 Tax=unclassified Flavobacterium TaxID=196869 RepID=UPI00070D8A45|nr:MULTISPECIES: hypothetical protein [unclassified Flavobacterium]KRD62931.1 hypothetical protein ASE40_03830 [Flavobacterium sp. Root935]MDQ1168143.1 hypothetical protein [Flavobacterium sp. SORGH_AS_0622]TDX13551.1 hypothetical protein EDB96_0246 [Flavobacterium sp. S87F.05.LMB.W.Kidney.N]BDU24204.1 hypothetical protein FLGSB24_09480 [Flavobacterium sp. GSB-24]